MNCFISVASEIGFDENIVSVADTINEYNTYPIDETIKRYYRNYIRDFDFQTMDYDDIPGKLIKVAHPLRTCVPLLQFNRPFKLECFQCIMKSA